MTAASDGLAVAKEWTAIMPGEEYASQDGRFAIRRHAAGDWRLSEMVRVCALPGRWVRFASMEFDRRFASPREGMAYAVRIARQLLRPDGRRDRIIGRGRPPLTADARHR